MKASENNLLTSEEVCSILKTCAESQVRELKFGALYVSFGKQTEEAPAPTLPAPVEPLTPPTPVAAITEVQHQVQNKQAMAQAELSAKEDQLALLAIENPMEFERQLMNGELENESDAGPDDEA